MAHENDDEPIDPEGDLPPEPEFSVPEPEAEEIPEILHSEYEDRPFQSCTRCGETLADFAEGFQLSKVWKNKECVMEYAICIPCHQNMVAEFSEDSREAMIRYQDENVKHELGLETCAVCENAAPDDGTFSEFGITGMCQGTGMFSAILICGGCSETMQELVSEQTRGRWNRFVAENFPCAPSDVVPEPTGMPIF